MDVPRRRAEQEGRTREAPEKNQRPKRPTKWQLGHVVAGKRTPFSQYTESVSDTPTPFHFHLDPGASFLEAFDGLLPTSASLSGHLVGTPRHGGGAARQAVSIRISSKIPIAARVKVVSQ